LNRVFINRTLNMKQIKAIGFDMDHTLIRYFSEAFEGLAFQFIVEKLVDHFQYPESIRGFAFNYDLAIRGLIIDQRTGFLLKLDRFSQIHTSFQGSRRVPFQEQRRRYNDCMIDPSDPRFLSIDTAFSISVASLFMQLVDLKMKGDETLPDYDEMASDVVKALDHAHGEGSLKAVVARDLHKYIKKEPEVARGLERLKKHGKFLFIITNSEYEYAKTLLDYSLAPFFESHESWSELFDLVIVGAQKPRYFSDSLRTMQVNPETGALKNIFGAMHAGAIYQGGHARKFEEEFGFQPHEILYMGDHIYGDILRLKKDRGWRTGLILEGLDRELSALEMTEATEQKIHELMTEKEKIELKIQGLESAQIEKEGVRHRSRINSLYEKISGIDRELKTLIIESNSHFNADWGPIMRAGNKESYYAHQVVRYADIYMGQLSALTGLSPRSYLRAQRRPLPHEL